MKNIKNVIVVDDSKTVLKTMAKLLSSYDFKTYFYDDPSKALAEMKDITPDLILLDYFMPAMSGSQFMIKASEELVHSNWQVFLVSSNKFSEEERASMLTLGITHVFEKPLNKKEFDEAIQNFNCFS
jgi:DNA-binding response OmpR family regulator